MQNETQLSDVKVVFKWRQMAIIDVFKITTLMLRLTLTQFTARQHADVDEWCPGPASAPVRWHPGSEFLRCPGCEATCPTRSVRSRYAALARDDSAS